MGTETSTIVWEEPPAVTGVKGSRVPLAQAEAIADALRARPGEWAKVLTFPNAQKQAYWFCRDVKGGSIRALKGAEVKARTIGGDGVVYARFPQEAAASTEAVAHEQALLPDLDTIVDAVLARIFERLASR